MANSPDDDKNTRAIEKLRSWKEISKSAEQTVDPTPDDYATELELFEQGEIDKALWAKHLVEMRGNEEEAKWNYIKERVTAAPARRAEEAERRRKAEEEQKAKKARREAAEAEIKRKAAEAERKRKAAEAEKKRKAADKARQERLKLLGEERERQREQAGEEARRRAEEEAVNKAEAEEHKRKAGESWPKRAELNDSVSASVGSTLFLLFLIIVVPIFLINIFSGSSTEVDWSQQEVMEEQARDHLQYSRDQFYGVAATGRVEEKAALTSALWALDALETLDSDYAKQLRDSINAWRVTILTCASSSDVRDLLGAEVIKRQVVMPSETDMRRIIFWDVYWGESSLQSSHESQDYRQLADEAKRVVDEWGLLNQPHTIELVNALERAAKNDHLSAYELAQYYECRTENQDFETAFDWYVRALENAKKTQDSSDPVDEDTVEIMRSRLERLRKVISATYLQ